MVNLLDWTGRQQFERKIIDQVDRGDRVGAAANVEREIRDSGDRALEAAADAAQTISIEPWDEILADCLDANRALERRSARLDVVALDLINRDTFPDLRVRRRFYANPNGQPIDVTTRRDLDEWHPPAGEQPLVFVHGLEPLVAVQRTSGPSNREPEPNNHARAHTLSGVLIVIRYLQAVEISLREQGLPAAVPVIVSVDLVSGPQEHGMYDYGRPMTELMLATAAPVAGRIAEMTAARATARAQRWEDETSRLIGQLRSIHHRVTGVGRLFMRPERRRYYRLQAKLLEKSLAKGMGIQGLPPLHRMSPSELDELERRVRQVRTIRNPHLR